MSDNKEIKPCMNTLCRNYNTKSEYGGNCCYYAGNHNTCPQYRDTEPRIWEPKNPDDYEPGCLNKMCSAWSTSTGNGGCLLGKFYIKNEKLSHIGHRRMCKCVPCYDPAPKPKTQRREFINITVPNGAVDLLKKHGYEIMLSLREEEEVE